MTASKKSPQTARSAKDDPDPAVSLLSRRYQQVRKFTDTLCEPLATEDYVIQTMEDVSPAKWHLAHTTWFFETFILNTHRPGYESPDPEYSYLFNSYYNAVGDRHCRDRRGFISRPTVADIYDYRTHVDEHMLSLLAEAEGTAMDEISALLNIGLHHEQQHQELLLTDIKHVFGTNPLRPAYLENRTDPKKDVGVPPLEWVAGPTGLHRIGHAGGGFSYDNETPRHRFFLEPFRIASRLVTNGEYLEFIADGGYDRPELWLSDGWKTVQSEGWKAPLYWEHHGTKWHLFTLSGMQDLNKAEPACHVSYYEADAYARWAGARLQTEAEWEVVSQKVGIDGNFADSRRFHPAPVRGMSKEPLRQMFGDVWEWTQSHYSPYPGYKPPAGAIGEYNGKFMCCQFVLRGGSCATSRNHIRRSYRNFFPPDARWQFSGIRLARDGEE